MAHEIESRYDQPVSRLRISRLARGILVVVTVLIAWMGYVQYRHRAEFGHFAPLGLHADVVVHKADIGIPGITNKYEARLTNLGFSPVSVERCVFVSDAGESGVMVAYNIERWDPGRRAWERTHEFAKPGFCAPVPLSMGDTHWRRTWLWPGQSLATGEEETGARAPFSSGDRVRFVVVTDVTGSGHAAYPTPPVTLDEQNENPRTVYRARH